MAMPSSNSEEISIHSNSTSVLVARARSSRVRSRNTTAFSSSTRTSIKPGWPLLSIQNGLPVSMRNSRVSLWSTRE